VSCWWPALSGTARGVAGVSRGVGNPRLGGGGARPSVKSSLLADQK
jgi:hypothetical protein